MKLFEIINTEIKTTPKSAQYDFGTLRRTAQARTSKGTEVGMYSWGKPHPTDPHEYVVTSYYPMNLELDAKYQYIKHIAPHIDSNPFLPRTYVVELKKDAKGLVIPRYRVEALKPYTDVNYQSIVALAKMSFPGEMQTWEKWEGAEDSNSNRHELWYSITALVDKALRKKGKPLENKELAQAIALIQQVKKQNRLFDFDIGVNNCMIRLTSAGPQLVITDPLYDKNFTSQRLK